MGSLAKSISQNPVLNTLFSKLPGSASGEWAYNLAMIRLQRMGVRLGSWKQATFRDSDWALRKYFIDRRYIETVIILPERLLMRD